MRSTIAARARRPARGARRRDVIDYTDPALSYLSTGWELEFATCLKLVNYPDANGPRSSQLVPEAAAGFPKISNDGGGAPPRPTRSFC